MSQGFWNESLDVLKAFRPRPDYVIHLASSPRAKLVNADPMIGVQNVIGGTVNILWHAEKMPVKKVVFISSSMIYGHFADGTKEDAKTKVLHEKLSSRLDMETTVSHPVLKGIEFIHENGKLEQKGKYLEGGRPHGLWVWYYDDSELLREMSYRRGKPEGEITEYNDTGKVVLKGSYFDGLEDGEWIIDEGDYLRKGSYVDGLEQGEWLHYYNSNNKVAFKGSYIEGEPHGKHTYYHPNGRKSLEGSYNLGEKIKDWKRYHPDGLLFMTMKYEEGQLIRINGKRVDKKR